MRKVSLLLAIAILAVFTSSTVVQSFDSQPATPGRLDAFSAEGKPLGYSPLKHTRVKADISGFLARVTVEQEFTNNFNQPIEAVYTFPLSENSAVDKMTMKIGERTISGKIKKREEAREIYEQAKSDGKTASLLDQERPNVFTQSVANILPNEKIVIEISYVENLKYEDGSYEFVFPMVVGERYSPASVSKKYAKKVTPRVARTRTGHDVSIEVNLDAGVPIENISSKLHEIDSHNLSSNSAKIVLKNEETIPNKDFILNYDVTGKRIEDAILTHRDERGGFFTMMLAPPENFNVEDVSAKEIVFVLDTSGSMSGFPIEKAKEAMKLSLDGLYPNDTFNLITFAGDTHVLFEKPVLATQENLEKAQEFLETRRGGGGTELMKAIKTALKPSGSNEHIRIVNFMTDGYVSNESEIISEIQRHPDARVFSFGIGDSVNRFLLSKMAEEGRGEATFVTLEDDGSKAAQKFHERIRNPLLTDISIDWNGMPVADVYPKRNPDLFDQKPVIINGRYTKGSSGTIKLKGRVSGQNYVREIKVDFPEQEEKHDVLATLWARKRIEELSSGERISDEQKQKELEQTITNLSLEFRLLTNYTSFVAVEDIIRTEGGKSVKVEVPVERANGTFGEGFKPASDPHGFIMQGFAGGRNTSPAAMANTPPRINSLTLSMKSAPPPPPPTRLSGSAPKRISGGVVNGKAVSLPAPQYPAAARAASAKGSVNVLVTIDESGNVISATPVSGHPLFRAAAATAAKRAKFAPTMMSGKPVQVSGVIVYNFGGGSPVGVANSSNNPLATVNANENESIEEETVKESPFTKALKQKLHKWVYELFNRLQTGATKATPNESKFARNGKARLQIRLSKKSIETIDKLKDLGLENIKETGKDMIEGEIDIQKIADLIEIGDVQYILPKIK